MFLKGIANNDVVIKLRLLYSQVPDRDFSFHVGQSGHWFGHLVVCGGSCLVSKTSLSAY